MINNDRVLAVIPARMGSKRLKNKNLLPLGGKPLISWTIETTKKSKFIDDIIVTSDDKSILCLAEKMNVEYIKRPKNLATDKTDIFPVIKHVLSLCEENYKYVILCQPTSPLRTYKDIDNAFKSLIYNKADAIISVSETIKSPLWSAKLPKNLDMSDFVKKITLSKRSQDLPKYFTPNGAIYICKISSLLLSKTFYINENIYAYIMPKHRSVDIDDKFDFLYANSLIDKTL